MTNQITKTEIAAGIETVAAIAAAIRDIGPKGMPAGHLYAVLADRMTLVEFYKIVSILVNAGLVKQDNSHVLRYVA